MPAASAHSSMKVSTMKGVGIIVRPAIGAGDDMERQQSGIDQDIGDAAERIGAVGQHGEMPLGGLVGDEHRSRQRHAATEKRPMTSSRGEAGGAPTRPAHNRMVRRRRALVMTRTELMLIAALAIIGLSSKPIAG